MRKTPIDALFSKTRQNILAATYGQPEKWWFMSELAAFMDTSPSSLQRELDSLSYSGILRKRRDGNRSYFQAERDSPVFGPLSDLVLQTLGLPESVKKSLLPLADRIRFAFIYGSAARGDDHVFSDLDVILVGSVGLADLSPNLRELEGKFGREINAVCYGEDEFIKKLGAKNHFLTGVINDKKMFLIGNERELEKLAGKPDGDATPDE